MKKRGVRIFAAVLSTTLLGNIVLDRTSEYEKRLEEHTTISHDYDYNFIAHRGYSSKEVENSKEAVLEANNSDCTRGIEFDVRLTSDGKLVLSHDDILTSSENISVSASLYEDIKDTTLVPRKNKINLKTLYSIENRIKIKRLEGKIGTLITLDETLELVSDDKRLFIELKFDNNYEELSSKVITLLKKYPHKDFVIQAFEYEELKRMMETYPEYTYQLIIKDKENLKYLDEEFDGYGIKYSIINQDVIIDILDDGKEVSLWTINSPKVFDSISESLGTYSSDINYITDNPDILCYSAKLKQKKKLN